MTKIFTKKEIAGILEVNSKSLSRWDDEKIKEELLKKCLKVIDVRKEGRSIIFECEYQEYSQSNNDYLQEVFNVKDVCSFKNYSNVKFNSIENESLEPRKEIAKKSNTCYETARNYDRKLKDKGVISTDGYLYICMEKKTGKRVLVDERAYKEFWFKHSEIKKELSNLKTRFIKSELTINQYNHLRDCLIFANDSEYMYSKVEKSIIHYDNELYKMLIGNTQ